MPNADEIRVPFFRWVDVYGEYVSDCETRFIPVKPVHMKWFRTVWDSGVGKKIKLEKTHAKFAICEQCLAFQRRLAQTREPAIRLLVVEQRRQHIELQRAERQCYYEKREKARYFTLFLYRCYYTLINKCLVYLKHM
jgi:hypothetical protein